MILTTLKILNFLKNLMSNSMPFFNFIKKHYLWFLIPFLILCLLLSYKITYDNAYKNGIKYEKQIFDDYKKKQQDNVKIIEKEVLKTNTKIVTEYVDKIKTIKEKEYVYVDLTNNLVPKTTEMTQGWINVHNAAVKQDSISNEDASLTTKSGVFDNEALTTVVENYSTCHKNYETVIAWQKWYNETKQIVDDKNKELSK